MIARCKKNARATPKHTSNLLSGTQNCTTGGAAPVTRRRLARPSPRRRATLSSDVVACLHLLRTSPRAHETQTNPLSTPRAAKYKGKRASTRLALPPPSRSLISRYSKLARVTHHHSSPRLGRRLRECRRHATPRDESPRRDAPARERGRVERGDVHALGVLGLVDPDPVVEQRRLLDDRWSAAASFVRGAKIATHRSVESTHKRILVTLGYISFLTHALGSSGCDSAASATFADNTYGSPNYTSD